MFIFFSVLNYLVFLHVIVSQFKNCRFSRDYVRLYVNVLLHQISDGANHQSRKSYSLFILFLNLIWKFLQTCVNLTYLIIHHRWMILDLFSFFFHKIWLCCKHPKDQKEIEESYVNGLHKTENWINKYVSRTVTAT